MSRRWFGPKSGSGRGLSALIGGLIPAAWQGWGLFLLLIAALVGISLISDLNATMGWVLRGVAVAVFLTIAALTYGSDPD